MLGKCRLIQGLYLDLFILCYIKSKSLKKTDGYNTFLTCKPTPVVPAPVRLEYTPAAFTGLVVPGYRPDMTFCFLLLGRAVLRRPYRPAESPLTQDHHPRTSHSRAGPAG